MIFQSAIAAFALSLACLFLLRLPALRHLLLDQPNERSLHAQAVPRSGGIAVAAGVTAGAVFAGTLPAATLLAAGVLALLSFFDDLYDLSYLVRLPVHLAAAAAFLALETDIVNPASFFVVLLAVVWSTNLYNFMDGADGLAGGMAVIGFGAYAFAAQQAGQEPLAALSAVIAAASAAFLLMNFPPARIFLGDVGSIPLGFLAGALGVAGWRSEAWPLWFPMLVFAPFACDATLTLLKRAARGEVFWQAHREHYYQRLVRMGFGHRGAAGIEYAAMAGCALAALWARDAGATHQFVALGAATVALLAVALWIDVRWARYLRESPGAVTCPKGNA